MGISADRIFRQTLKTVLLGTESNCRYETGQNTLSISEKSLQLKEKKIGFFIDGMSESVDFNMIWDMENKHTVALSEFFFILCLYFCSDVIKNARAV